MINKATGLRYPRNKEQEKATAKKKSLERRAMVDAIKLEEGCVDCGYRENPKALQFDHVRGEKFASVSRLTNCSDINLLSAEILKCEVRCANCHAIKTSVNGEDTPKAYRGNVSPR